MDHNHINPFDGNLEYWIEEGKRMTADRQRRIARARRWKFDTTAVHGLYDAKEALERNNGSIMEPVYLSTAQVYHNSAELEAGLAYLMPNWCYTRIANPSNYFLEETTALLESYGTGLEASCLATGSGMSAIRTATEPFLVLDDKLPPINIVTTAKVYGGTFQQFAVRRGVEQGMEIRWVKESTDLEEWRRKIDEGTRFVYGEFPSNPSVELFDIEEVAKLAHAFGIPLIVDSTCASPALTRPLQWGADIVVQSASKVFSSNGTTIAGLLTARKDIVSRIGCEEMKGDFATWAKFWPFRDNGPALHPMGAILTLNDLRTLRSRMAQMSRTAMEVVSWLQEQPQVEEVHYPGLESYHAHDLARRYMQLVDSEERLYGYMLAIDIRERNHEDSTNARKFYDALELTYRATDLGRIKTVATLNSISTHQQQGEEGRALASIKPGTCRISVGMEDPADIIADLEQALAAI
ncbi:MAG: aminotransferase class V-fold PLP-dependent enzyme [Candidatus Delongbacteria bacterium]|nr:aminotransferase class V-fold PLP-dependent enzyme [Candidatus Delongbacteria bacterium]